MSPKLSKGEASAGGDYIERLSMGERQLLMRLCQAGGGRARRALATILGDSEVRVDLYDAGVQRRGSQALEFGVPHERQVGVLFELSGDFRGHLTLLLSEVSARVLTRRLVGTDAFIGDSGALSADAEGVLSEVGNIVVSAFVNAFADALKTPWIPSPPELMHASADEISLRVSGLGIAEQALVIALDAQIQAEGQHVRGQLLFIPSAPVLEHLLSGTRESDK